MSSRYPTSPLSPSTSRVALSPRKSSTRRGNHGRQVSQNMPTGIGRYHPSNFAQADAAVAARAVDARGQPLLRAPTPVQMESPRTLKEQQKHLLDQARQAVSSLGQKMKRPSSPQLNPLGSPKSPVTPFVLELEGPGDYFSVRRATKSPLASPGARSGRSDTVSSAEQVVPSKNYRGKGRQ